MYGKSISREPTLVSNLDYSCTITLQQKLAAVKLPALRQIKTLGSVLRLVMESKKLAYSLKFTLTNLLAVLQRQAVREVNIYSRFSKINPGKRGTKP
jgi:hypothetical protein